jgi:hypothetical protein
LASTNSTVRSKDTCAMDASDFKIIQHLNNMFMPIMAGISCVHLIVEKYNS